MGSNASFSVAVLTLVGMLLLCGGATERSLASSGASSSVGGPARDSLYHATRPAMGTTFELYLYASDRKRFDVLFEAAYAEVKRIESNLSTYDPTSELSRLNARAARAPVTTDPEVFGLLQQALSYSRQTDGAFDITVGPLVEAWGFFRRKGRRPTRKELLDARSRTGWQRVQLDSSRRTVHVEGGPLKLDLGAIGKGYALDQVAALLRQQGVEAALIGLGMSTYFALGAPPKSDGWTLRVPSPFDDDRTLSRTRLCNEALSTSGSYEQFFRLDGRTYSHIIDPRTGQPVQGRVQVTVVAPRATDSDALSTALFVLGVEEGRRIIDVRPKTRALIVQGGSRPRDVHPLSWSDSLTTIHSIASKQKERP